MRFLLLAVVAFVATAIFWNVVTVAVLRNIRFNLSFFLPFHLFRRSAPEVLDALKGKTINTYVLVSGVLLFACPLLAGLSAYDYVVHRYVQPSPYDLKYIFSSAVWLVLLVVLGTWISLGQWQRSKENGIGLAMLAIVILKVSNDLTGSLTAVVFLAGTAAFCSFVYFGIRRIRDTGTGKQSLTCRDTRVQRDFVSEPFVPSESPAAEKVAMVQKLMIPGPNVDSLSNVPCDDEQA